MPSKKRKRSMSRRRVSKKRRFSKRRTMRIRPEVKYIAQAIGATAPTLAGTVTVYSSTAQGIGQAQRIGNKTVHKSTFIKGFLNTADAGPQVVRFILFRWKEATAPVVANILGFAGVNSPYAPETQHQYRVLKDWTMQTSPVGQEGGLKKFSFCIRRQFLQQYNGVNAANIVENSIYLLVITTDITMSYEFDILTKYIDA